MRGSEWRLLAEGYAQGPERIVKDDDGDIFIRSYWTDQDGVCVSVDADGPVPGRTAALVAIHVIQLSGLPAPEPADLVAC